MLIRPHDAGTDEAQWREFVTEQGFGHFVVSTNAALPTVVPTQFLLGANEVVFHLAKVNPVFDALAENPNALLSVAGDWAYIPGGWKAIGDEDPTMGIPTTYYAAVQITGRVTIVDDPDGIAAILNRQTELLEAGTGLQDPTVHVKKFAAIRGIRLSVDDVRAKFKYGGNVDTAHRVAIAARLADRGGAGDLAAARRVPEDRPQ